MSKPTFSIDDPRSAALVAEALPGGSPSSPNSPANMQAAHAAAQAELDAIRAAYRARRDAVRHAPIGGSNP
jgi:hypothetical protein